MILLAPVEWNSTGGIRRAEFDGCFEWEYARFYGEEPMSAAVITIELVDFAKLVARTIDVFGSPERAVRWLETTNPKLGGKTPLAVYQSSGSQRVEEELIAIEHGVVA
jgi:hypothetical protein